MIISVDVEKTFDINQCPLIMKVLERIKSEKMSFNIIQGGYDQYIINKMLKEKLLEATTFKSGTRQACPLHSFSK